MGLRNFTTIEETWPEARIVIFLLCLCWCGWLPDFVSFDVIKTVEVNINSPVDSGLRRRKNADHCPGILRMLLGFR